MVSMASAYTAMKKQCLATNIFEALRRKKNLILLLPLPKKDKEFETNELISTIKRNI